MEQAVWRSDALRVLDYGCADGFNLLSLAEAALADGKQFRGIGLDVAQTPIDEFRAALQQHADERVRACISVQHLTETDDTPLVDVCDDESLDIVTVLLVLHHMGVNERQAVLKQLSKKLKPGGSMIVADFDSAKDAFGREAFGFDMQDVVKEIETLVRARKPRICVCDSVAQGLVLDSTSCESIVYTNSPQDESSPDAPTKHFKWEQWTKKAAQ